MNIEDLIEYENESTYLDFKEEQYLKPKYYDFVKDIISMSNADIKEDKFIIIGINKKPDGSYSIKGINKTDFVDSATYQQIITENIEPYLPIEYTHFTYKNQLLGVFTIKNNNDKPYMMKKDFGPLKKGDSFIRKGTSQNKLLRSDIDKILEDKINNQAFEGEIEICFSMSKEKEIVLKAISKDFVFPSDRAEITIKNSIKCKIESDSYPEKNVDLSSILNKTVHYKEARKIIEDNFNLREKKLSDYPEILKLLNDLKDVKNKYKEEDHYELFEENSNKININILNKGKKYIKDAAIELRFKKEFLAVNVVEIKKPKSYYPWGIDFANLINVPNVSLNYPEVNYENGYIKILYEIGDLKHHINNIEIFDIPIRVTFSKNLINKDIEIYCKVFGENLPKPLEEILRIKVIE